MQHIFNIAIDVDDDRIKKAIERNAEKAVIEKLTGDVEETLFNHSGWGSDRRKADARMGCSNYLTNLIIEFLNSNRDEIINRAAQELATRLMRTKKAREILEGHE